MALKVDLVTHDRADRAAGRAVVCVLYFSCHLASECTMPPIRRLAAFSALYSGFAAVRHNGESNDRSS